MKISDQLKEIPPRPGIYIFYDSADLVLYVGKAVNLRHRVRSYFSNKQSDRPWVAVMIGLIARIETMIVANELEALMLESTLIKQRLPKFNLKLTDDKTYPFIKLSRFETIPRFSITRRRSEKTGDYYFGPYLSARAAQHSLEFLRELYGVHISNKPLPINKSRPCFHCQLTGQPCPCADEISSETYSQKIDIAVQFLRGQRQNLLRDLAAEMERAAESQQFERAVKLRDQLHANRQIATRQHIISTDFDNYDAIGVFSFADRASVCITNVRDGRVNGQQHFYFENTAIESNGKILRDFLVTMYPTWHNIPRLVVVGEVIEDQQVIEKLLTEQRSQTVKVRQVKRGKKYQMVLLSKRNAEFKLQQRLISADQAFGGLMSLQQLLGLLAIPARIEAIDISNFGASEPVGACVCFINGQPAKNEYRRYVVKGVEGPNDLAMVKEVVWRRLTDVVRPRPDLLLIDGGSEQLAYAILAQTQTSNKTAAIISLAKKPDRIFLPNRKKPIPVARGHQGLLLLARIRDEAHRYALSFQRSRQRKKSLKHSS